VSERFDEARAWIARLKAGERTGATGGQAAAVNAGLDVQPAPPIATPSGNPNSSGSPTFVVCMRVATD